jgi:lysophospholipid acyltransferase (LPLAT)-like uncharacterized protein
MANPIEELTPPRSPGNWNKTMRIRGKTVDWLLGVFAVLVFRCLFKTLRLQFHTADYTNPYVIEGDDRFIYCVWHDQLLIPIFGGKHRHTAALVSQNRDGSFVEAGLRSAGILPIRGSSNRGGALAMRQLIRESEGKHIVMTPDGPRGPRRELSAGVVFLAAHSGRAIVPTAFTCESGCRFGVGWTDLLVPKPFSKVHLLTGEPIHIAPDTANLRTDVARVQAAMLAINARGDQLAGLPAD